MPPAFICNVKDAMPYKNKKYRAKAHSIFRAHQRYGIWLNGTDLYWIGKKIRNGQYRFVKERGKDRFECTVYYKGYFFRIWFDRNLWMPVTFIKAEEPLLATKILMALNEKGG